MQEKNDSGLYCRYTGKEGFWTGRIYRERHKRRVQDRRDTDQEKCWTRGMKDRWDAEQVGCRTGGSQDWRDT